MRDMQRKVISKTHCLWRMQVSDSKEAFIYRRTTKTEQQLTHLDTSTTHACLAEILETISLASKSVKNQMVHNL